MNITTRKTMPTDAYAISLLSTQLGYSMTVEDTRMHIEMLGDSNNDMVLTATAGDMIVGWMHVTYAIRVECMPFCEIAGLVVDEGHRGKSIGRQLIQRAIEWSVTRKCNKLKVYTNVKRTATHAFYTAAGFILAKEQKIFEMEL